MAETESRSTQQQTQQGQEEEPVLFEIEDGIATITLNRPHRMNAFNWRMGRMINDALERCDEDDDVRAIVVTGKGRAFCAGADLGGGGKTFDRGGRQKSAPKGGDARDAGPTKRRLQPWEIRKPIIAAINGAAVGVGLTIPLQYDMRIAALDAKLGFVFVNRGIMPELGSSWILPRLIGPAHACDLLLTGRIVTGEEAARLGFVNEAVPKEQVLERAMEIARHIAVHSAPISVAVTKRMIWENLGLSNLKDVVAREAPLFGWIGSQKDAREGVVSFVEKRDPAWQMKVSTDMPEFPPVGDS